MPLTIASLHILLPDPADANKAVTRGYRALGFAQSNDQAATREAVIAQGHDFVSVYDSACASGDDGTLRKLAASLSAALRTCAIVTTVQDSEDFEFLLFHLGRQVDAAVADADGFAGELSIARGQQQAEIWRAALGATRFDSLQSRAGDDADDPAARFASIARAAVGAAHQDAEDRLAAWCRLAQLPVRAALRGFIDAAASPGNRRLKLAQLEGDPHGVSAPLLASHRCDDDYPYHRFFPAAWPTEAGAPGSFVWPILCRHRGLRNPRVVVHFDQTGGFTANHIGLAAHSAQHGRLVAAAPLIFFGQAVPPGAAQRAADLAFDFEPFELPAPRAGRHTEFLLLLRLDITAPASGEALITPTLRGDGPDAPPLVLPTLRVAAQCAAWQPVVSDALDENPARRQAVLRLNAPACLTQVAILPDSGQDLRDAVRVLIEAWVLPMTDTDLIASIQTQRHPNADASGLPASEALPMAGLLQGAAWPKLFQARRDLQSVQVEIGAQGAPHGLAGFSVQTSLRDPDRRAHAPLASEGTTLAVSLWAIADEAALALLRLDMVAARAAFAAWVRAAAPLQAWMADCAWVPGFDTYQATATTLYEAAACVDWMERGLAGTLCDPAWPRRRLRFAARHMWLGWELATQADTTRLTKIATVTAHPECVEIDLHPRSTLSSLERLLVPVLPMRL